MSNGSILPPDIQAKMKATANRGSGGVGGGARENETTARQRDLAMNPGARAGKEEEEVAEAAPEEEKIDLKVCPNVRCRKDLLAEWSFCATCGEDLVREGPGKRLGITWKEEDLHDYIFRGYVIRDVKVLGTHKVTMKSSQPQDLHEIDDYIMNGAWSKGADGSEKKVSDFYIRQVNALCQTAACIQKFDGESIGSTLVDRIKYLNERGSAFVDMLSSRVVLFNRALTEYLKRSDSLLGS
jgi:hypothetical protein